MYLVLTVDFIGVILLLTVSKVHGYAVRLIGGGNFPILILLIILQKNGMVLREGK
jgi:hypothetical protein